MLERHNVMREITAIDTCKTWRDTKRYLYNWDGIEVATRDSVWFARIEANRSCCENFGYFSLNDEDASYFIGADLLEVDVVDTALNTRKLAEADLCLQHEGNIMFVNFVTSKGVLQFAVYNEHNGYYGHVVQVGKVTLDGVTLTHEDTL